MNAARELPLGIDLGAARIRAAHCERDGTGRVRVKAVAVRDFPEPNPHETAYPVETAALLLEQLRHELGTRMRRCVIALPARDALVRAVTFPRMGWSQRRRAAAFECDRWAHWPRETRVVRVHPLDPQRSLYAVGVTARAALESRHAAVRAAGLRAIAVDHPSTALRRALPEVDAVLDVGREQTTLHTTEALPRTLVLEGSGGAAATQAIAADLAVALAFAESRKRILGTAGAGEAFRRRLVERVAEAIASLRATTRVASVALVGNGCRLAGLAADISAATQARAEIAVASSLRGGAYPEDVVRAAAPDWTLAVALAAWSAA